MHPVVGRYNKAELRPRHSESGHLYLKHFSSNGDKDALKAIQE